MGIRSWLGRTVGNFGTVLRKVGDFGGAVARKVGEFSAPIGGFAASIADMVGRPDIAAAINKGTDWLQRYAPKAEEILSKVQGVGGSMKNVSNHLLGT